MQGSCSMYNLPYYNTCNLKSIAINNNFTYTRIWYLVTADGILRRIWNFNTGNVAQWKNNIGFKIFRHFLLSTIININNEYLYNCRNCWQSKYKVEENHCNDKNRTRLFNFVSYRLFVMRQFLIVSCFYSCFLLGFLVILIWFFFGLCFLKFFVVFLLLTFKPRSNRWFAKFQLLSLSLLQTYKYLLRVTPLLLYVIYIKMFLAIIITQTNQTTNQPN